MTAQVREIRPGFVAEISGLDLREPISADDVAVVQNAIDHHPVLVFPGPTLTNDQQIAFSRNFGPLSRATEYQKDPMKRRLGSEMTDASNLSEDNQVLGAGDRRRMNNLGSRRWHTDGSFKKYPVKYSLLAARSVVRHGGETQFADMRAAYDALPEDLRQRVDGLIVEHNLLHSRRQVGFVEANDKERNELVAVHQPLVRVHPRTGRKSLYLSSHASHVVGWPLPEGLDLLYELTDRATQREFVYTHAWRLHDVVMWDNRVTMHRARPFPAHEPRDMRRTTLVGDGPTVTQAS